MKYMYIGSLKLHTAACTCCLTSFVESLAVGSRQLQYSALTTTVYAVLVLQLVSGSACTLYRRVYTVALNALVCEIECMYIPKLQNRCNMRFQWADITNSLKVYTVRVLLAIPV